MKRKSKRGSMEVMVHFSKTRLKLILRALHHRNFRLFVFGQSVSLTGTWMQQLAMSWLVYRLTGSAFMLGAVTFAAQIPLFVLTPLAGIYADRADRLKILLTTQTLSMLQAFLLAFLVMTGSITVAWLMVLSLFIGTLNAFDVPARQSFFIDMIDRREDLGNAIALNSSIFNAARLIGPSIAGFLIAMGGEALCFFVNAFSFVAVLAALLSMRLSRRERAASPSTLLQGVSEGFSYAFGFKPIRYILALLAFASLISLPYTMLMPVIAKDVLHGGPETLGFLVAAAGLGALIGALYMASRKNALGLTRVIPQAVALFGLSLAAFSLSRHQGLSLFFMVFAGFGMMVHLTSTNTVLQTVVEDDMRGRIMSLYTLALMGVSPFGSLVCGWFASQIGAPKTLFIGGIASVVGAWIFWLKLPVIRENIRPVYLKKGILPRVQPENG